MPITRHIFLFIFLSISLTTTAKDNISNEFRSFKEGDLYGFKDVKGRTIIEPQYQYAFDFVNGAAIVKSNGFFGHINTSNQVITPFDFEKCGNFNFGSAMVMKNGKTGFVDRQGKFLVDPKYDNVKLKENGYFVCYENGKAALHGGQKGLLTGFIYNEIDELRNNTFYFQQNEKFGVLNSEGEQIGETFFAKKPYCYGDVWKEDTIYYFIGEIEEGQEDSYMSMDGKILIDGAKYRTAYGVLNPYELCIGEKESMVINIHTGEIVVEPTSLPHYRMRWRPCSGQGYEWIPYIIFGEEGNYQFNSLENPDFVCENLVRLPQVTEEFIITHPTESSANLYSRDGKLLVEDAQIGIYGNANFREPDHVCLAMEEQLMILKKGKVATGSLKKGEFKFKKKGNLYSTQAFFGTEADYGSKIFMEFKRVYYKKNKVVYSLIEDEYKYFFVFLDGYRPTYLFRTFEYLSVKIDDVQLNKVIEDGEEVMKCTIISKIDNDESENEVYVFE